MTTDIFQILGQSYEELKEFKKAEESYKNASMLVPTKFQPKYRLFELYKRNGNKEKTREIALDIKNMKIKVFSDVVRKIKTEANEYLSLENISK